jgi:hypothetical protein
MGAPIKCNFSATTIANCCASIIVTGISRVELIVLGNERTGAAAGKNRFGDDELRLQQGDQRVGLSLGEVVGLLEMAELMVFI